MHEDTNATTSLVDMWNNSNAINESSPYIRVSIENARTALMVQRRLRYHVCLVFPQGILGYGSVTTSRLDIVVWIDNPALENPKILGVCIPFPIANRIPVQPNVFAGASIKIPLDKVSLWFCILVLSDADGEYHDLIMWGQLTN
ncbi:unnamed protein product [Phytophthora lilii]|uniref:Unnamed protein product n=1 Tax=Phytophthora lilii TaxID=2077276 RepID=A0A9W6WVE0_9STRA|nr:unnamed protein product [Phytophthora lilii]